MLQFMIEYQRRNVADLKRRLDAAQTAITRLESQQFILENNIKRADFVPEYKMISCGYIGEYARQLIVNGIATSQTRYFAFNGRLWTFDNGICQTPAIAADVPE